MNLRHEYDSETDTFTFFTERGRDIATPVGIDERGRMPEADGSRKNTTVYSVTYKGNDGNEEVLGEAREGPMAIMVFNHATRKFIHMLLKDEEVRDGCGAGQGENTCAYLARGANGWFCGRTDAEVAAIIRSRLSANTLGAKRDPIKPYPECQKEGWRTSKFA